ncbi:hypothetical protein GE061_012163 [Apolygus lucorum]|uniref:C2H2-type domain-containing protein n=1 Tax=Apolygus lucorum TaxID=248454 RepID=A0A8S9XRK7_APOLU|nr:hypothetical protein GE061_012163 [Apolygus lucorum]
MDSTIKIEDGVDWTTTEKCEGLSASIERFESTRGDPEIVSIKDELSIKIEPNDGEEFWIDKDDPELEAELRRFSFLARKTPLAGENLRSFDLSDDEIKHDFVKKDGVDWTTTENCEGLSASIERFESTRGDPEVLSIKDELSIKIEPKDGEEFWIDKDDPELEAELRRFSFLARKTPLAGENLKSFDLSVDEIKHDFVKKDGVDWTTKENCEGLSASIERFESTRGDPEVLSIKDELSIKIEPKDGEEFWIDKDDPELEAELRRFSFLARKTPLAGENLGSFYLSDDEIKHDFVKKEEITGDDLFSNHEKIPDISSTSTFNMQIHLRVHTGERPNACQFCDFKTRRRDCLEVHIKKLHNNDKNKLHN